MKKRLRCHCGKASECKLCHSTGYYEYEVGPAGYQPFRCPTCEGKRSIADATNPGSTKPCPTCRMQGNIDPATSPGEGLWDKLSKIFMGA